VRGHRASRVEAWAALRDPHRGRGAEFLVDALAAARLIRLATRDTFPPVKRTRNLVIGWAGQGSSIAELVDCPWCAGFWITAGVVAARRVVPRAWAPVADVFAAAFLASYLAGKSTEEGDPADVAEAIERAGAEAFARFLSEEGATDTDDGATQTVIAEWSARNRARMERNEG
jgi:hypothetical protein